MMRLTNTWRALLNGHLSSASDACQQLLPQWRNNVHQVRSLWTQGEYSWLQQVPPPAALSPGESHDSGRLYAL